MIYGLGCRAEAGSLGLWSLKGEGGDILRGTGVSSLLTAIEGLIRKKKSPNVYSFDLDNFGHELLCECLKRRYKIGGNKAPRVASCMIALGGRWQFVNIGYSSIHNAGAMFSHTYQTVRRYVDKTPEDTGVEQYAANILALVNFAHRDGFNGDTISGAVWSRFRGLFDWKNYAATFPRLDKQTEKNMRRAYSGAFTFCKAGEYENVLRLDINSAYDWAMSECYLPYGQPVWGEGAYEPDPRYPLYIQFFSCMFRIKPGKIPFLTINNHFLYDPYKRLTESIEPTFLAMTNIELSIFLENYDVFGLEELGYYKFRQAKGRFTELIGILMDMKTGGDSFDRQRAKDYMTHLYGKPAQDGGKGFISPVSHEGGIIYRREVNEDYRAIYLPLSIFIVSYVKQTLLRACAANLDRLVYADTDSLHLLGFDPPDGLLIDDQKLGAWKVEAYEYQARYLKTKCYATIEAKNQGKPGRFICKSAGLPKAAHDQITWDNFRYGAKFVAKKKFRTIERGIVEKEVSYELKKPVD